MCAWADSNDGVDVLCHEQHRVDASFTWQPQGCGDVSESAEALIRTEVNHCTGNLEEIEAAWGEVSQESSGFTTGGLQLYSKGMPTGRTCLLVSNYQLLMKTNWTCLYAWIYMPDDAWAGGWWDQQCNPFKWMDFRNVGNVKPDLCCVYSAIPFHSPELGS